MIGLGSQSFASCVIRGSVVTSDAGLHRPGLMIISAQRVVGNFRTSGQFYTDFLYP
jgi:hypothetical protein